MLGMFFDWGVHFHFLFLNKMIQKQASCHENKNNQLPLILTALLHLDLLYISLHLSLSGQHDI